MVSAGIAGRIFLSGRYYVKQGQKKHRMDNLIQKQRNSGKAVPDEILREQEFLER